MTTNYQRALDLADHIAEVDESHRELVKQLHDAGLLAPDLPEPTRSDNDGNPAWPIGKDPEETALAMLAVAKWHKEQNR